MNRAELKCDRDDLLKENERHRSFLYKINGLTRFFNWGDNGNDPGVVLPSSPPPVIMRAECGK